MTIAMVGAWTGAYNTSPSPPKTKTTAALDTTGANLLVAVLTNDTDTGMAVSDSKGNTWSTAIAPVHVSGGDWVAIYYCVPSSAGTGHTITGTASASNNLISLSAAAYSGIDAVPLDRTAATNGSGYNLDSGATATTAQADELIIGGGTLAAGLVITWTAGPGFTLRSHCDDAANAGISYLEDRIVAATGAYSAPADCSVSGAWHAMCATFKGAVSADNSAAEVTANIIRRCF